nr:hypothetical protein [Bacteroidota bacterium]
MKKSGSKDEESLELLSNEVELDYVLIKVIVFYFIYKIIIWQSIIQINPIFGIGQTIIIFLISMLFTFILGSVIVFIYERIIK